MRLRRLTIDESGASPDALGYLAFERDEEESVRLAASPRLLVADILRANCVPAALAERITVAAREIAIVEADDPIAALAAGLAACLSFAPLRSLPQRGAVALVGPPGVGKTTLAAKLAARRGKASIVDGDAERRGATTQLAEFAAATGTAMHALDEVADLVLSLRRAPGRIIVDTSGINPFDPAQMARLVALVTESRAEPILVLPANVEPTDAATIVAAFRPLPIRRLVVTRLDMVRRLGGLLAAVAAGGYDLLGASVTANLTYGLCALTPTVLARRLVSAALIDERWRTQ